MEMLSLVNWMGSAVCILRIIIFLSWLITDLSFSLRSTYWPDCDYWSHGRDVNGRSTFKLVSWINSHCVYWQFTDWVSLTLSGKVLKMEAAGPLLSWEHCLDFSDPSTPMDPLTGFWTWRTMLKILVEIFLLLFLPSRLEISSRKILFQTYVHDLTRII